MLVLHAWVSNSYLTSWDGFAQLVLIIFSLS